jgi:HD-GYP domain-containing protein (c-di-GMP phosphodiesterase class II)
VKKSETDGRRSLADLLAAADCRSRFLGILQSKLATNGIEFNLDPEQAMVDSNTGINAILRSVSEALSRHLGFGEAVIALFRDLHLRSYILATSAAQDSGAESLLTKPLEDVLARGYSPRLGDCTRIEADAEGSDRIEAGAIVAPIFIGEGLIGAVAAMNDEGRALTPEQEARLLLAAAVLGSAAQELASGQEADQRVRSLAHALSGALDARNPRARGHSHRVAMYAMAIMNEMGLDDNDSAHYDLRNRIRIAALLHDVGKIGIPDAIIERESELDEGNSRLLRQHPVLGAEILKACYGLGDAVPGVLYHHERYDGSGYPFELRGDSIPLSAKVIALADTFDTMTSNHGSGEMCRHEDAVELLTKEHSKEFDPDVLNALRRASQRGALAFVRLPRVAELTDRAVDAAVEKIYGRQLISIPSLPEALHRVNSLLENPEASLKEVADLLTTDTGLASRVLKLVNSAYYGLPRMVSTIPLATTILGITAIKSQVVNIAYADAMKALGGCHREYLALWRHALKTASWARTISQEISDIDAEEVFTAGLIHDVGRALCLRLKPGSYGRLVAQVQTSGRPLIAVEEEVMGFDHMRMGGWIAARWNLPEALVASIRWHHDPEYSGDRDRAAYELIRIIHIADIAARASECVDMRFVPFMLRELSPRVLKELGSAYVVDLEQFKDTVEEAEKELEETFAEVAACVS